MSDDRLSNLLREIDATSPPPPLAGLASAVLRRARARSRRRRVVVTTIVLFVPTAAALSWFARRPDASKDHVAVQPPAAMDFEALQAESARLQAEADLQTEIARRLGTRQEQRERVARESTRPAKGAHVPTLRSERDRAALTLLDHGDRLRRELKQVDAARAAYRRTIELFPETHWAVVAKQRVEQLEPDARDHNSPAGLT
jgi:hypothetical protein